MYCKRCGKLIEDDVRFCVYCGQDQAEGQDFVQGPGLSVPPPPIVEPSPQTVPQGPAAKKGSKRIAVIAIAAVGATALLLVVLYFGWRALSAGRLAGQSAEATEAAEEAEQSGNGAVQEEADGRFSIDPDTVADYSACLEPAQYQYYDSGIGLLNFYYPRNLYREVTVDEEEHQIIIGNQLLNNVQTVQFYASDGSEALFQVADRTEDGGIDPRLKEIFDAENQVRFLGGGTGEYHYETGYGYFYLSGYEQGEIVYEFVRMDNAKLYRFFTITPPWADDTDRAQKEYVLTCMERLAGFSVGGGLPSYREFLSNNAQTFANVSTAEAQASGILLSQERLDLLGATYGELCARYTMSEPEFTHAGIYESTAKELSVSGSFNGFVDFDLWLAQDSDTCYECFGELSTLCNGFSKALPVEQFVTVIRAEGYEAGMASYYKNTAGYAAYGSTYYEIYIPVRRVNGTADQVTLIIPYENESGMITPDTIGLLRYQ